jgi:hypothetical protein
VAGQAKVLNMMEVGGSAGDAGGQVAEISRTLVKRLDVNFTGFYNGSSIKIGTRAAPSFPDAIYKDVDLGMSDSHVLRTRAWGQRSRSFAPAVTQDKSVFLQSLSGNFLFNLVIDAAKNNGWPRSSPSPT